MWASLVDSVASGESMGYIDLTDFKNQSINRSINQSLFIEGKTLNTM